MPKLSAYSDVMADWENEYCALMKEKAVEDKLVWKEMTVEELEAVAALPIMFIKNYDVRSSLYKGELWFENKVGDQSWRLLWLTNVL